MTASPLPAARRSLFLLALVLAAVFLTHLLVLAEPFGRDQGIFAYIGDSLRRGAVPYRDAWDHKPPGIYAIYALAFSLFGRAMAGVQLLEGIAITLTALALYVLARRLYSERVGLLAALFYGLGATLLFEWWDRGQAEVYMAGTGVLAVLCFAAALPGSHRRPLPGLFLAGVFCGLTVYLKPTGAPLGAALAVLTFLVYRRSGLRRLLAALAALAAGFALSFVPLVVYFAANGALDDLVQTVIVFNTYHARIGGNPTLAGIVTGSMDFLASMNVLAPLALTGAALYLWRNRWATGTVLLWLLAAAAGIWTQGKFFSYHWSPVLPPLALLAALGAEAIGQQAGARVPASAAAGIAAPRAVLPDGEGRAAGRWLAPATYVLVLAVFAAALATDHLPKWQRDLSYLAGRTTQQAYLAQFSHNIQGRDIYSFQNTQDAADYIKAHTAENETVLVWGFQALLNFLADRQAPTRYIFNYPLTFDRPESAFRVQARRTFLRDLGERPPAYIVLVTNDVNPLQAVDSYHLLEGFPEFQEVIRQHYHLEVDIGEFHLYRRNSNA